MNKIYKEKKCDVGVKKKRNLKINQEIKIR